MPNIKTKRIHTKQPALESTGCFSFFELASLTQLDTGPESHRV